MNLRLAMSLAIVLCLPGLESHAVQGAQGIRLAATGISIPIFDEAGILTHRLTSERGTLAGAQYHLEGVELVTLSPTDPTRVVRRMRTVEANWDQRKEVLEGPGAVHVETEDTKLHGEEFRFELGTAQLTIARNFALANPDVVLNSDRAIVDLVIDREEDDVRVRDLKRFEAAGNLHVVVQPAAQARYNFDEAFSDRAIYDGASHTITLPNEVRLRRDGQMGVTQRLDIELGERGAPTGR
jgi:hypothetical protein